MTVPQPIDETAFEPHLEPKPEEPAFKCHTCKENRGKYLLGHLSGERSELFCESCLIITFAQVANDVLAAES